MFIKYFVKRILNNIQILTFQSKNNDILSKQNKIGNIKKIIFKNTNK